MSMNAKQVIDLGKEVTRALAEAVAVAQERDMLRRVLKQAVLTHGGELRIDTALADAAKNDKRTLEIGGGGARLNQHQPSSANLGWRERAAAKQAEAHGLVKLMEDRVSKLTTDEVDAELASLVEWREAVAKSRGPVDRRSLLVDILYLDLAGSGEDSPSYQDQAQNPRSGASNLEL